MADESMLTEITREDQNVADDTKVMDDTEEENLNYEYSITSFGADYPVDGLMKRLGKTIIIPDFQRPFVWTLNQSSRFIESLLIGLPVPEIFLSLDPKTRKMKVIDGQQRLKTLKFFYDGIFKEKEVFKLANVQSRYEGKTYKTLDEEDKIKLDDSFIHATIVKQDIPSDDESSIYQIFERLNTGATKLSPQEIRNCIFNGSFNDLIKELSKDNKWLSLHISKNRLKDQELILRFLAFYYWKDKYKSSMKEFLNLFMGKNKEFKKISKKDIEDVFYKTVKLVSETLGRKAFRLKTLIVAAVFDAVMIGISYRLKKGEIKNSDNLKNKHSDLIKNDKFIAVCSAHTSDTNNVKERMDLAIDAFKDID